MEPEYRFCKSADGTEIGYIRLGQGPYLVNLYPTPANFEALWVLPGGKDWLCALAEDRTVLCMDRRGTGLSQRDVTDLSLEAELADMDAVLRAEGIDTFDGFGAFDACAVMLTFAAMSPARVQRLVLFSPYARFDFRSRDSAQALMNLMVTGGWSIARKAIADAILPSGPIETSRMWVQTMKQAMSPETYRVYMERETSLDVVDLLPTVAARTLVMHRKDGRVVLTPAVRFVASHLPQAELVLLSGDAGLPVVNPEQLLKPIREFFGSQVEPVAVERASSLATILFTDLVGHTEMMSRLGDERGRDVLREHERITREVLKAHGGTEVKTMGDGFMASFGSVTRAVECAVALQRAFADHPGEMLNVRVGLNAGEPIEEDGDLFGATVILASRIAAKAGGGEILVADTVRGLCSGKGFLFSDRGEFVAKGFDEAVRVFEVSWK